MEVNKDNIRTFFAILINSSTLRNGQSIGGRKVRPCKLITATSVPLQFTKISPFPGVPSGKLAGLARYFASSMNSNTSRLSQAWFPSVTACAPHSKKFRYIFSVIPRPPAFSPLMIVTVGVYFFF